MKLRTKMKKTITFDMLQCFEGEGCPGNKITTIKLTLLKLRPECGKSDI